MKASSTGLVDQQTLDFCDLMIKYYGHHHDHEDEEEEHCKSHGCCSHQPDDSHSADNQTSISQGEKPKPNFGPVDYSKWASISSAIPDDKPKKSRLDINSLDEPPEDPHKDQIWGCAQDHRKERDIYERPNSEKMAIIADFKKKGDEAFRAGKYDEADYFYQRVSFFLLARVSSTWLTPFQKETKRAKLTTKSSSK